MYLQSTVVENVAIFDMAVPGDDGGLGHLSPEEIICWAVEQFPSLVMTSAFGLNGVALIHMLQRVSRDVPIIFVDTGCLFEETLQTKRRIEAAYGVEVLTYTPRAEDLLPYQGCDFPGNAPDLCCNLRKVEPMRRAMEELGPAAVLSARARFQSKTRRQLQIVEWERAPVRVNPLAHWSRQEIQDYVIVNQVPYNPLHDQGYPSIGCQPCTRPVGLGEDLRAGRWAGLNKTECGLWTTDYAAIG